MADWKKLVVSGSNISQLNNDSGYLTSANEAKGFATASFNGVDLLADSSAGTLSFASGSGQGLTISASAGDDKLTFGLSAIPNSSLANTGSVIGSTLVNLGATVTSIAGLTLTNTVGSDSFSGSFEGDGSGLTGLVSTLFVSGTTGNGSVDLKTETLSILGTSLEVETSVSGQTVTIGLPSDVTIGNNLTVTGDLFVNGTTTQINTTDLLVEDKFILLASGSATAGDAGIVIDRGSDAGGNVAYGFDSATGRWGYQNGITDTDNAITIGTNGGSAFAGYVFTEAAHTSRPTTGEFVAAGAIYTATSGDIFIYS
jgi:hypothetical protein